MAKGFMTAADWREDFTRRFADDKNAQSRHGALLDVTFSACLIWNT